MSLVKHLVVWVERVDFTHKTSVSKHYDIFNLFLTQPCANNSFRLSQQSSLLSSINLSCDVIFWSICRCLCVPADSLDGVDQTELLMNGGVSAREDIPIQIDQYDGPIFGRGSIRLV